MLCSVLVFSACKKEASEEESQVGIDSHLSAKVSAWLDAQKVSVQADKVAHLDLLKKNLLFSSSWTEDLREGEKLIIIPLQKGFKSRNNIDKNPGNNLLFIVDNAGKIRRGNIVQFLPQGASSNRIPHQTFHNIYNFKKVECNGRLDFLSIHDELQYEFNYQNGKQVSFSTLQNKPSTASG